MNNIPQEVLNKYQYWNVEHVEWWDYVVEDFVEDMAAKGIITDTEHVFFTGFCCQGDGACFKGYVETRAFFDAHPYLREEFPYHAALNKLDKDEPQITIKQSGHYSHEYSMSLFVGYDADLEQHFNTDEPLGAYACRHLDEGVDSEISKFEEAVLEIVRDYARTLYHDLREEYEYLTSDEQVAEAIEANELWTPDEEDDDDGRQAA